MGTVMLNPLLGIFHQSLCLLDQYAIPF